MRLRNWIIGWVLLLSLSGCATSLTNEGERVQLIPDLKPEEVSSDYTHIGIITCQKEQNLASVETNRKNCENDLRNRAAEKGADVVVIESYDTFPGTATVGVSMIGHLFRRR